MADRGGNELEISGDMAELRRFRNRADERLAPLSERDPCHGSCPSALSFHRRLPVPASVAARDCGAPGGGYEWQKANWGVKWEASVVHLSEEADSLVYSFETAWSAPRSHSQEAFAFRSGKAAAVDL